MSCATAGVQISVNDQLKGTAPWSSLLPPGTYVMEERKEENHPQHQTVNLSKHADRTVSLLALMAKVGRLDVDYQPVNTEMWMDGRRLGVNTDIFRNIQVGSHEVELRASGHQPKKETVTIEEGKTAQLAGRLTKVPTEDAKIAGKTPA